MNQMDRRLTLPDRELAYQQVITSPSRTGKPSLLFLGGFASDMTGTKATFLKEQCEKSGVGFLCFDYRGHGASSGKFEEGCIGDWFDDALKILDNLTTGPQILIGSSMGGWIALLLAKARGQRVAGFVGLAAAPDFTEDLIKPTITKAQQESLEQHGYFFEDNAPEDCRVPITQRLMEDGAKNLVLRENLTINGPVRLIQGQQDIEVPWQTALTIADKIEQTDIVTVLIKDGTHRLSRDQDLALIWREVSALLGLS